MQNFSIHTHTIGFDGNNSVSEMLEAAEFAGLKKLGISNHFIVHPVIKDTKMYDAALQRGYQNIYSATFGEAIEKFKIHYDEIDEVCAKTGIKIYKGMEVDFFAYDGWRDGFERALEILKPDYLIGSAHFVATRDTLYNSHDLKNADKAQQNMLLHKYYQNVRAAAGSGLFDFLAHLDLMKKVGLGLEDKWEDVERQTIEAIRAANAKVEINTSGFKLKGGEPYPSRRILKLVAEYGVPVLLSDDAHDARRLGDKFDEAYEIAKECGIKQFYDPFGFAQPGVYIQNQY